MTIEEFKNTRWRIGMEVILHSKQYGSFQRPLASVNFDQALIGIEPDYDDDDQLDWFRCENCGLIEEA